MEPIDFVRVLLVSFVTLFPVVNPIGDAPIFLALTQRYPSPDEFFSPECLRM
jgi:small neutral amino acid transporter SnatA (MarC family)